MLRERAQFWVAIMSTLALVSLAIGCAIADERQPDGKNSQVTLLAVGALSALSGACIQWLFPRDGNGQGGK